MSLEKVKEFYYGRGMTAQEVGEKLGTTPWMIYKFMEKSALPRRTLREINRIRFEKAPSSFVIKSSLRENEKELLIANLMLHWGEGTKQGNGIDFANSDSRMIQLFLRFLREICNVTENRLRVYLYCHADQDVEVLKEYWSKITRIPLVQFTKPYIRKDTEKKWGREMKYGMVHIRYSDTKLLLRINKLLQEYLENWVGTQAANEVTL